MEIPGQFLLEINSQTDVKPTLSFRRRVMRNVSFWRYLLVLIDETNGNILPRCWTPFDAEKAARDHALATFLARKQNDGIVAVEVRKDDGTVVFSQAGAG